MSTIKLPESNFMVLEMNIRYEENIVLPYKDGITVLTALEKARVYKKPYNDESQIRDIITTDIRSSSIGAQEYGEAILRHTLIAQTENK